MISYNQLKRKIPLENYKLLKHYDPQTFNVRRMFKYIVSENNIKFIFSYDIDDIKTIKSIYGFYEENNILALFNYVEDLEYFEQFIINDNYLIGRGQNHIFYHIDNEWVDYTRNKNIEHKFDVGNSWEKIHIREHDDWYGYTYDEIENSLNFGFII